MATLSIANLRKTYGKTVAVDDLTVDIRDGEFFVILGPSGAGKTTTLNRSPGWWTSIRAPCTSTGST